MMKGLMILHVHVIVIVHWTKLTVLCRYLLQYPLGAKVILVNGFAKRKMIHRMRQVGHGSIQIAILGFGFIVKVTRHAIHQQVSQHLTSRMLGTILRKQLTLLSFSKSSASTAFPPRLDLFVHFQLALGKARQGLNSSIHLVVGRDSFALVIPTQGGKGHVASLLATQVCFLDAVNTSNANWHTLLFIPCANASHVGASR